MKQRIDKVIQYAKNSLFYIVVILLVAPVVWFLWKIALSIKIDSTKTPLEILDYLSIVFQFVLVLLGVGVFVQVKQSKTDLRTRCIRESCIRAMDLSEKYAKEIIPQMDAYNKLVRDKGFKHSDYNVVDFYLDEIVSEDEKKQHEKDVEFFKGNPDLYKVSVEALNACEALAMNFMKGIADEEIVFTALSQTYCLFVKNNTAFICQLRDRKYNIYTNLVSLYKLWYSKLEDMGLELQQKNVLEQLNTRRKELKEKSTPPPKLIGVDKK